MCPGGRGPEKGREVAVVPLARTRPVWMKKAGRRKGCVKDREFLCSHFYDIFVRRGHFISSKCDRCCMNIGWSVDGTLSIFFIFLMKLVDGPNRSLGLTIPQETFSNHPGLFLDYSHSEFCVPDKDLQILETFTNQNTDFSSSFSQTFLGGLQKGTE